MQSETRREGATRIQDIAVRAGVSPATVSRVLNGGTRVSPEKAERVRRAVEELRYRPDGPARNLRRGVSDVWAVIIPDIENPFLTSLVRGVEDVAQARGQSVVLCNSDDQRAKEDRYLEIAIAERMAGVIISVASSTASDLSPLLGAGVPVVLVVRRHARHHVDGVFVDDRQGAFIATSHLVEQGARRPACITGPPDISTSTERLEGYREALSRAGLRLDERLVRHANFRYDGGYEAVASLLSGRRRPDAIFATNNLMGVAALDACADHRVAVPDSMSIACFDDVPWGRHLQPRLTFVSHPAYSLGQTAALLLLDRRERPDASVRHLELAPNLVVGESSVRSSAEPRPPRSRPLTAR